MTAITTRARFDTLYDSVAKTISFLKEWQGPSYSMGNAVNHVDRRLMLDDNEMARSADRKGRRVVFIGTVYGLIAIYETSCIDEFKTIAYDASPKLADKNVLQSHVKDLTPMALGVVSSMEFRDTLRKMVELDNDAGDGMKVFEKIPVVRKKKYPPRRPHKERQNNDDCAPDNTYSLPA